MRLGDTEWVDDTQQILKKNSIRELSFLIVLIAYVIFAFYVIGGHYVTGIIILVLGIVIFLFIPKKIKMAFPDLIAYDLYRLFLNIEKYNGRNPHFKEEAKKALVDLDIDIDDYIKSKKKSKLIDFDGPKNEEYILRLQDDAKRIVSFFSDYNKYKNKQETIKEIVMTLAFLFHDSENFPINAYELIDELDKIDIPKKPIRIEFKPLIKKYFVDNVFTRWVSFSIIFSMVVWYLPNYTRLVLTMENKLIIIIPVLAIGLIQIIFPIPQVPKNP